MPPWLLAVVCAAAACSKAKEPPRVDPPPSPAAPLDARASEAAAPADATGASAPARPPVAMPDAASLAPLVEANNRFGFALWKELDRTGNLAASPTSISLAFAMTVSGARGETRTQMKTVLGVTGLEDGALATGWGALSAALQSDGRGIELRIANRLFGEATYPLEAPFLELTRDVFHAPIEGLDFRGNPEPARKRINAWVAEQTSQRIAQLIPAGGIDPTTRLVLVNAIYVLADWASPFDPAATRPRPFQGPTPREVPTMRQTSWYSHAKLDGVTLVELGYRQGTTSMIVALPDGDVATLEDGLDATAFARWLTTLDGGGKEVALSLPRFTIDPAEAVNLQEPLQRLGMTAAFSNQADFTGIARRPTPADELKVAGVYHQAFVKVDEAGTEAAAATAVVMAPKGAPEVRRPEVVTIDRPFLFFVIDRPSGLVLFMGRVVNPSA